jgi:hypothetical protein
LTIRAAWRHDSTPREKRLALALAIASSSVTCAARERGEQRGEKARETARVRGMAVTGAERQTVSHVVPSPRPEAASHIGTCGALPAWPLQAAAHTAASAQAPRLPLAGEASPSQQRAASQSQQRAASQAGQPGAERRVATHLIRWEPERLDRPKHPRHVEHERERRDEVEPPEEREDVPLLGPAAHQQLEREERKARCAEPEEGRVRGLVKRDEAQIVRVHGVDGRDEHHHLRGGARRESASGGGTARAVSEAARGGANAERRGGERAGRGAVCGAHRDAWALQKVGCVPPEVEIPRDLVPILRAGGGAGRGGSGQGRRLAQARARARMVTGVPFAPRSSASGIAEGGGRPESPHRQTPYIRARPELGLCLEALGRGDRSWACAYAQGGGNSDSVPTSV